MAKVAVLTSSHSEVARIKAEDLDWVYCMASNPQAEDLLKVVDVWAGVYWCDSIEFVNE